MFREGTSKRDAVCSLLYGNVVSASTQKPNKINPVITESSPATPTTATTHENIEGVDIKPMFS